MLLRRCLHSAVSCKSCRCYSLPRSVQSESTLFGQPCAPNAIRPGGRQASSSSAYLDDQKSVWKDDSRGTEKPFWPPAAEDVLTSNHTTISHPVTRDLFTRRPRPEPVQQRSPFKIVNALVDHKTSIQRAHRRSYSRLPLELEKEEDRETVANAPEQERPPDTEITAPEQDNLASLLAPDISHIHQAISSQPPSEVWPKLKKAYHAERHFAVRHRDCDIKDLLTTWSTSLSRDEYHGHMRSLILGSFFTSITYLLNVMSSCPSDSGGLNFSARASLLFVLQHCHRRSVNPDRCLDEPEVNDQFQSEISRLRDPQLWPTRAPRYSQLKILLDNSTMSQRDAIFDSYTIKYVQSVGHFDARNFFRLVHHILSDGDVDRAWTVFLSQPSFLLPGPSKNSLALCSQLLAHDVVVDTPEGPNFKYLPQLLRRGYRLDDLLRARLIERAIDLDHSAVAWDLLHHMRSHDRIIHPRVYLLLLRHSFLTGNIDKVNELMTTIYDDPQLHTNPRILVYAMNIVRVICCYERKLPVHEAIPQIIALYDRVYNRDILVKLGICDKVQGAAGNKPAPPPEFLASTIWSCVLCAHNFHWVNQLWKVICTWAGEENSPMEPLLAEPALYHAFLIFYTRSQSTLRDGLMVLQHMRQSRFCEPDITAWSIMACGLLKFGQRAQAAKLTQIIFRSGYSAEDLLRSARLPLEFFDLNHLEDIRNGVLDDKAIPPGLDFIPSEETNEFSGTLDLTDLPRSAADQLRNFVDLTKLSETSERAYAPYLNDRSAVLKHMYV